MKETIFDKEYNLDEYKWDERLSYSAKGIMNYMIWNQEGEDTRISMSFDDINCNYVMGDKKETLKSLEELLEYQYIEKVPQYKETEWHNQVFCCYVYKLVRDRDDCRFDLF